MSEHEKTKLYPIRYPWSGDSVGIEVAAKCINQDKGIWEVPTAQQKLAINRLVDIIVNIYELNTFDIYEHDQIAYKTVGEGAELYTAKDYEHSTKNLKTKGQWVNGKGVIVRNK
ncbi:TPA: hypothetical protein O7X39_004488 [Salmonella enterica]|nr:hypothetical protein [Salmonella enterica]